MTTPTNTVRISNLPNEMNEDSVWKLFEPYVSITSLQIMGSGNAIMSVETVEDAIWCVNSLNGFTLSGLRVPITVVHINTPRIIPKPKTVAHKSDYWKKCYGDGRGSLGSTEKQNQWDGNSGYWNNWSGDDHGSFGDTKDQNQCLAIAVIGISGMVMIMVT